MTSLSEGTSVIKKSEISQVGIQGGRMPSQLLEDYADFMIFPSQDTALLIIGFFRLTSNIISGLQGTTDKTDIAEILRKGRDLVKMSEKPTCRASRVPLIGFSKLLILQMQWVSYRPIIFMIFFKEFKKHEVRFPISHFVLQLSSSKYFNIRVIHTVPFFCFIFKLNLVDLRSSV